MARGVPSTWLALLEGHATIAHP